MVVVVFFEFAAAVVHRFTIFEYLIALDAIVTFARPVAERNKVCALSADCEVVWID